MRKVLFVMMTGIAILGFSQEKNMNRKTYIIANIAVDGDTKYKEGQIKNFTKLNAGDTIVVPGSDLSFAIKRLMKTGLFNDVEIYADKVVDDSIYLKVRLEGLSKLHKVEVEGVKKAKASEIIEDSGLKEGDKVTENLINTTRSNLEKKYKDKGFLHAKATIATVAVDSVPGTVDMRVKLEKGKKIKINDIVFEGNQEFNDARLRKKAFKKTKRKSLNLLQSHKYNQEKYKEDLKNLVSYYQSFGFRDAAITADTVYDHNEKTVDIKIGINEGKRYFIRKINFVGNNKYSTEALSEILGYTEGDYYDAVGIQKKSSGDGIKEQDINSLYMNEGYLFSKVTPYETRVDNDSVDIEIRVYEGEQAYFKHVDFEGNEVTYDKVVQRNIQTQPGELFSKADIIQTIYRLSQVGYFDPQQIEPDVRPNPQDNTVDITYKLAEQGASQVQLQGGYGGGRFIGTLALSLNNFSLRNIFKKEEWAPFPQGDGQTLSLSAQAGSNYQNYSFSFTEPWIFGKRPTALTVSLYHSIYQSYSTDGDIQITGAAVGLNHTLNWPDSYFRLSQVLNFRRYDLNNYDLGGAFTFDTGVSHNLSYKINFGRFSAGPDSVFPTSGSNIDLGLSFTPPYSLFKGSDFYKLSDDDRQYYEDNNYSEDEIQSIEDSRKYKWLEYYKVKMKADFYKEIVNKFVLRLAGEFGYINGYNSDLGAPPFERFYLGGTGLYSNSYDGREAIPLRGYEDPSTSGGTSDDITPSGGGVVYNKFMAELRYPISMGQTAKIYALGFVEAGNSVSTFEEFQPFELNRAGGFGLRVFMPMFGLLGIDFAYGFDPYPGQIEPAGWITHFILNQQF